VENVRARRRMDHGIDSGERAIPICIGIDVADYDRIECG
jgi:hypothetical protein